MIHTEATQVLAKKFRDVESYRERLMQMGFEWLEDADLEMRAQLTKAAMQAVQYPVNSNQLGVTMYAAYSLERKLNRQILSVSAGQGKSRVIVAIVRAIACTKRPVALKFQVVYNHEQLLNQDKEFIENICKSANATVTFVVPHNGVIVLEDAFQCTIIDEVDYILLDRQVQFQKLTKHSKIIGLTATASADLLEMERIYLSEILKFSIVDSHIKPSIADSVKPRFCDYEEFFSEKYSSMGRIIYCDQKSFQQVRVLAKRYSLHHLEVHEDCEDLLQLQHIEADQLFLVSKQQLMRGFDYRSQSGLALLIVKLLDSKSALKQALNRVGRYNEDVAVRCVHPSLNTLTPIDETKAFELVRNVTFFIQAGKKARKTIATNAIADA